MLYIGIGWDWFSLIFSFFSFHSKVLFLYLFSRLLVWDVNRRPGLIDDEMYCKITQWIQNQNQYYKLALNHLHMILTRNICVLFRLHWRWSFQVRSLGYLLCLARTSLVPKYYPLRMIFLCLKVEREGPRHDTL